MTEPEFHAQLLEARLERRIIATRKLFWTALAISNLLTAAVAVVVTLHIAHQIWRLHP
jgi:hypothetical protein